MIIPQPMSLVQQPDPFDDWDWIYEIKHDGFRALAVIEQGQCRFLSRRKHKLTGHQDLRAALVKEVNVGGRNCDYSSTSSTPAAAGPASPGPDFASAPKQGTTANLNE
jgi:hypothetical protein